MHGIANPLTSAPFAMFPRKVVTYGIHVPQAAALSTTQTIEVPLKAPSTYVDVDVHPDPANEID